MNEANDRRDGERVQKLIARAGVASRRAAEELIREGRVTINGQVAELGNLAGPDDSIKIDGRALKRAVVSRTLMVNKPTGVITTLSDPEGRRTVLDLVPPRLRRGLFPVGRLDFATEGMLLLTTDGALAQQVAHPRHGCQKTYEVKVKGVPEERALERLRRGMRLHGKALAPVEIERRTAPAPRRRGQKDEAASTNSWWKVRLTEGKTRQIREMFQRIGHPVQRLRRTQIGGLALLGLRPGDHRELTEQDIEALLAGPRRALSRPVRATRSRGAASGPASRPGSRRTAGAGKTRRGRDGGRPGAASGRGPKKGPSGRSKKGPGRRTRR